MKTSLRLRRIGFIAFAITLLALRYYFALPYFNSEFVGSYIDKKITLHGIAQDPPDIIEIKGFKYFDVLYELRGRVQISSFYSEELEYGDEVEISGALENSRARDPQISAFVEKPRVKIISSGNGNFFLQKLFELRRFFIKRLEFLFPERISAFASGLLLGNKSQFSAELTQDFKRTGLMHIVALSGYNIVILISSLSFLFAVISRKTFTVVAVAFVLIFTLLVGASASVVRAAIMGSLTLLARAVGRKSFGLRSLFITAYFMLLISPFAIHNIGFQLSFAATAGILLFTERIKKYVRQEILATTLAAQIFTLPLVAFYFKSISLIAPLANLFILPLIPFLMLGSALSLLFGKMVAPPTMLLFEITLRIIHFFAAAPFGFMEFGIS